MDFAKGWGARVLWAGLFTAALAGYWFYCKMSGSTPETGPVLFQLFFWGGLEWMVELAYKRAEERRREGKAKQGEPET